MRCVKCGQELPDDANFCRRCGSPTIRNMSYLVQKARENDQEALTEIYKISSPAVYKTIRVLIKDEDTVYDILQDTYVKAFTRLDQLQNPDKLIPWLKMIANNLAKDWLKKSKPMFFTDIYGGEELEDIPFEESIEDVRSELNPEMAMDQQEAKRLVMEILDHLPEDQRVVIGMFYYEEMSVKDIAQTLGVSENTVKSRLSYGRRKIKEQVLDLEKRGTKLYSVAPFVFFLYLLGKADKVSAEPMAQKALRMLCNPISGRYPDILHLRQGLLEAVGEIVAETQEREVLTLVRPDQQEHRQGLDCLDRGMQDQMQANGHQMRHIQQPRPHQRRQEP